MEGIKNSSSIQMIKVSRESNAERGLAIVGSWEQTKRERTSEKMACEKSLFALQASMSESCLITQGDLIYPSPNLSSKLYQKL